MKRSLQSLLALSLVTSLGACALEDGSISSALGERDPKELEGDLSILTQNQYLGADFTPVFRQVTAAGFDDELDAALLNIEATNWPLRSLALALQIVLTRPDVVALQEVGDFTLNALHNTGPLYRDRLLDTLVTLAFLGSPYLPVAQVHNWSLAVAIDRDDNGVPEGILGILDRDVTLVRVGLTATAVNYGTDCPRDAPLGLGCRYATFYTAINPTAIIPVYRGFCAADVTVGGNVFRVVNTQLEQRDIDPQNPFSPAIQASQAFELLEVLEETSDPDVDATLPVGDFESDPEDEEIVVGPFTIVPPYLQFVEEGYYDTWLANERTEQELTCCQFPNLLNVLSALSRRIDFIFSSVEPDEVDAAVLGDTLAERLLLGLWPSRHGSVVADLTFGS